MDLFVTGPKRQRFRQFTEEGQALGDLAWLNYTGGGSYLRQTAAESNTSNLDVPIGPALALPVTALSQYSVSNRVAGINFGMVGFVNNIYSAPRTFASACA